MSEMLANQYFISERYSEALEEYSGLPLAKQDNITIIEKMIICATLDENFTIALSLLKAVNNNYSKNFLQLNIQAQDCLCKEFVKKLEMQNNSKDKRQVKDMQIAILSFFYNKNKSTKHLQKLENSSYADLINTFLKSLNNNI